VIPKSGTSGDLPLPIKVYFVLLDVVTKQDALILPYVATLNVIQVVKDC
jgi:hypothetical protein